MPTQLLQKEDFTSIQEAQSGLARLLARAQKRGSYYRVLRNNKPVGVLLSNKAWEGIVEDLSALTSPSYLENIRAARKEKRTIPGKQARKLLGL